MMKNKVSGGTCEFSCLRDGMVVVLFTRFRKSRGVGFVNKMSSILAMLNLGACGTSGWEGTGGWWKYWT